MRRTHLAGVDLNLLVALEAILRERNVTRAAAAVGLSQPDMSRALGRLRDLFDDPLLVRSGHRMIPTPRALELAGPLETSLEGIRRTLEPPGAFDPARDHRAFVISALDTTQAVILPDLLERIARAGAGGVELSTAPLRSAPEAFGQLASGERDFAIGRFESAPRGIRRDLLYRDRIVCVVRRDHPRIRAKLGLRRYLAESHLAADSFTPVERPFTIESLLAQRGLARRVVSRVENLAIAPLVVSRTDLLCTAPERTILPFSKGLGVRVLELPFPTPDFELHLAWHERQERDGGHAWLRKLILDGVHTKNRRSA
jgi:DNA-binding transcriptional LysR family regulator